MRFFTNIFDLVQKYSLVTKVTNFAKGSRQNNNFHNKLLPAKRKSLVFAVSRKLQTCKQVKLILFIATK